jgi:hypothetical protein
MSDHLASARHGLSRVRGTVGYAEAANALAVQYEAVTFDEVHRDVLHLVPSGGAEVRAMPRVPPHDPNGRP